MGTLIVLVILIAIVPVVLESIKMKSRKQYTI